LSGGAQIRSKVWPEVVANKPPTLRTQWVVAIGESELTPTARLVAWALATFMNTEGQCWPAPAEIARRAGVSLPTVKRCLRELRASDYLAWQSGGGRWSSRYQALTGVTRAPAGGAYEGVGGSRVNPQPVSIVPSENQEVSMKYPLEEGAARPSPNGGAPPEGDLTPEEARASIEWVETERKAHRRKKLDQPHPHPVGAGVPSGPGRRGRPAPPGGPYLE
jgi:Helix-turn-helix domain